MANWFFPALAGFLTGILSSWGIGGGTLLLLIMTLFLGVEPQVAQGINLVYFLPTAATSLLAHRSSGYLDRAAIRTAVPVGLLCALPAALMATGTDTALLRRGFGLFLLWAGLTTLFPGKGR